MSMIRAGKSVIIESAISSIPDGARIYLAQGSGTPFKFLEELDSRRQNFQSLEFVSAFMLAQPAPLQHLGEPFRWLSLQPSPAFRDVLENPYFDIIPGRYSDLNGLFDPGAPLAADVLVCQVSSPRANGKMSLGTGVGGHISLLKKAPLVIGQVNPLMPYVHGEGECHRSNFDLLVEITEPLKELAPAKIDATSKAIASYVAPYIRDNSTLQFGIGAIPDAVLSTLDHRAGLGLHGGMINDACIDLIESGVVDNLNKGCDLGVSVAAEIMGTRDLYDWVDNNSRIRMANGSWTHGLKGLASVKNFIALQSTVEVALDGSCNSEYASGRYISGPGGAPDFAFGASVATGGRSILAMPSTAAKGKISRIVTNFQPGAPTTLPSYTTDIVVTEFGAVELRGKTLRERAELLVSIAHPDFHHTLTI